MFTILLQAYLEVPMIWIFWYAIPFSAHFASFGWLVEKLAHKMKGGAVYIGR